QYRAVTRAGGAYNVPNMRVGGPYRVTATRIGYKSHAQEGVFLSLGQDLRVDFALEPQAIELEAVEAAGQRDPVLNPGRTGAATFIDPEKVALLPSVKRSTRDLIRVDPRNDGNYSFSGRNWLYNNSSLDGPLVHDKLFFFVNGEIVRSDNPGSDFVASSNGSSGFGISRVDAAIMDSIRRRMMSAYNYDPGPYQGYLHHTDNDKFIAKL